MIKMINNFKVDIFFRILCSISFMTLIFVFSSQNGFQSHQLSRAVLKLVNSWNLPIFNPAGNGFSDLGRLDWIIRKIAHFNLYFILGLLFYWIFSGLTIKLYKARLMTILFCSFYSITDEIHQLFVTGRTFHITDVFIDMMGSATAIMLVFSLIRAGRGRTRYKG